MYHNSGVTFDFFPDDSTAIRQFETTHLTGFRNKQACFANYHSYYKTKNAFYLEIPCVKWVDKCVEQFNSEFKHVNITILGSKKGIYKTEKDRYGGETKNVFYVEDGEDFDHQVVLIKFQTFGRYAKLSRYVLFKMLGILFRSFSITEGMTKVNAKEPENVFEYLNNINDMYQGWGHTILETNVGKCKHLTKELILLLDNIKVMNKAFKNPVNLTFAKYRINFTVDLTQHFYQTPVWNHLYQTSLEEK